MRTTSDARIKEFTEKGWWGEATILSLLGSAVQNCGDQTALVDPVNREEFADGAPLRMTFREVDSAAQSLAAAFFEHGIRQDDIALVQLPNIAELPIIYLALARLGAIISPVPVQYGTYELAKAQEILDPSAYITTSNFKGQDFATNHGRGLADSVSVFAFGASVPDGVIGLSLSVADEDPSNLAKMQAYADELEISSNDILTICWTSGTTGTPKGVPRSHNQWIAIATAAAEAASVRDGEALLNPFPLVAMAAISGFLFPWLMRGSKLVMHHPFDLPVFLKQIEDEKIGYTIAPPAILNMMLKQCELLDTIDLSHLRAIGSGSAPLSPWMIEEFTDNYGIEIVNLFGSNEGICLTSNAQELPDAGERAQFFPRFGVAGFEWSNPASKAMRTRLMDLQTGEEVSELGVQGELEIWGATVFDGYWKSPDANAEVFSEDGFFRTGDVFEIAGDQAKLYKFVGRCKDIIIRGGLNISPDEIDNLLAGHPKIAEVAVVGYADEIMGEKVGAVVVPRPGETVELSDLTAFLQEKGLAKVKWPEKIKRVDELPHNATGKVMRRQIKNLFDEEFS